MEPTLLDAQRRILKSFISSKNAAARVQTGTAQRHPGSSVLASQH